MRDFSDEHYTEEVADMTREGSSEPFRSPELDSFESLGLERGDVISHKEMAAVLQMTHWDDPAFAAECKKMTIKQAWSAKENAQLIYMRGVEKLKVQLLKISKIALAPKHGEGFLLVHSRDQAVWAFTEAVKNVSKHTSKGVLRAVHTETQFLSAEERQRHNDLTNELRKMGREIRQRKRWFNDSD